MARRNFYKIGQWDQVHLLTSRLGEEFEAARNIALKKIGLHIEGQAKRYMSTQTLDWEPLKAATIRAKVREGESEKILIATSTYFQSITSWVREGTAYAGVKRKVKSEDGEEVADIARIHEYGLGNNPERELWKPSLIDAIEYYTKKRPHIKALKERLSKYGVV